MWVDLGGVAIVEDLLVEDFCGTNGEGVGWDDDSGRSECGQALEAWLSSEPTHVRSTNTAQ